MEFFFESHATSLDNEKKIASGHNNSPLSEKGVLQAIELGLRYADVNFQAVYCSDLSRSRDTARIAFGERNIPLVEDPRLREWNYGTFNGAAIEQVDVLKAKYIETPFPTGESLSQALARVENVLTEILLTQNHELPILLVGHRLVFYALEHYFKKCSLEELVTNPWKWQPGWHYS